ncbi:MAG: 5'-3' exonuclease H3TH domain-containing protein [bacterium]|nr:5'-3' exonuclease H3TH domain-containing protein [bacterium]
MAKIYLIDTMFLIFRSFYALPDNLINSKGQHTGAVVGVYKALQHLVRTENITHCIAAFESSTPNFRRELDGNYKANRRETPPSLAEQIPLVMEMCRHLGITVLNADGYEADDVLATLAKRYSAAGAEIVIVSNDKDLAQVLQFPGVSLLHITGKKGEYQTLQADDIPKVYGVSAEKIPAWLALMGDSADNIIGVKGIGEKTAAKMLNEHSLDELLNDPAAGGARFGSKLTAAKEQVLHNLKLTQICFEVPLAEEIAGETAALKAIDVARAREFFAELQMKQAVSVFDDMLPEFPTAADIWI